MVCGTMNKMGFFASLLAFVLSLSWCKAQDPVLIISSAILPTPARGLSAVYDGEDSVFLLGGFNGSHFLDNILKFNISSELIEQVGTLPAPTGYGTALWDGTSVVYFGGNSSTLSPAITRYSPGASSSTTAGFLPMANHLMCIVKINEPPLMESLILGGSIGANQIVKYSKNFAHVLPDRRLPQDISRAPCIYSGNGIVFIFGGTNRERVSSIVKYDVETGDSHVLKETLPFPLSTSSAVFNGSYGFILGGLSPGHVTSVVGFDPSNNNVSIMPLNNFPDQLEHAASVYIPKLNRAIVFGGSDSDGFRNSIMYLQF